jgi:hypothetical protein
VSDILFIRCIGPDLTAKIVPVFADHARGSAFEIGFFEGGRIRRSCYGPHLDRRAS